MRDWKRAFSSIWKMYYSSSYLSFTNATRFFFDRSFVHEKRNTVHNHLVYGIIKREIWSIWLVFKFVYVSIFKLVCICYVNVENIDLNWISMEHSEIQRFKSFVLFGFLVITLLKGPLNGGGHCLVILFCFIFHLV